MLKVATLFSDSLCVMFRLGASGILTLIALRYCDPLD